MEMVDIAIISRDREYAEALAWAIARNTRGMEIWVYDDPDHISSEIGFDLLLTDMAEEEISDTAKAKNLEDAEKVFLNEEISGVEYGRNMLFKYMNVRILIREMYKIRGIMPDGDMMSEDEIEKDVYCFASEYGGSGCTSAAAAFAGELGKYYGKKPLFISLDQFPENDDRSALNNTDENTDGIREDNVRSLKQFLYHILNEYDHIHEKAWTKNKFTQYIYTDENDVMSFEYADDLNPLLVLSEKEFLKFFGMIMSNGRHDILVVDCGSQISMQMIRVMESAKRIFLIKDDRSGNKGFRKCLGKILREDIKSRMILLNNRDGKIVSGISTVAEKFA